MENANNLFEIPLVDVHSEHCALIVDKTLDKNPNITYHKVGYDVATVKKSFPVLNMTCASCASSSQSILQTQPGVINVAVNYANTTAQIEYIPTITSPHKLKAALQSIGYDLMIDETEEAKDSLDEIHKKNYKILRNKTVAAILLSIPLVIIGMFFMNIPYANYIMWGLSTPVIGYIGSQFFINAWKQTKHGSANMDTLVALSTGVAYLFSVFNTLFPDYWHQKGLHAHVYFEAAAVVIAFILLGKLLEDKAKGNTSSAIKKLMGLQPKTVTVVHHGGHQMEVPIASVKIGDTILVKPGEKIAVDGKLLSGNSFVDESMISGEPISVEKNINDLVLAGTINQKGSFQFVAEKVGGDTMLAQIIKMVQDAQGSKAPVQKLVDKIAGVFVPIVIVISILSLLVWIFVGGENGFTQGLLAMVTVLVIACPCALGLATPTAIMVGVGKGAEAGILIKDAESLETTRKINAIILDKTGTEGRPIVTDAIWFNDDSEKKLVFASIEKQSEHPLAEAVVNYFGKMNYVPVNHFESITGSGAKAVVDSETYFVGNLKLLEAQQINLSEEIRDKSTQWLQEAKTTIFFANTKEVIAALAITDKVKSTSVDAIKQLKAMDIEVYMLTGDNRFTAEAIAKQVGISQFKAEVLPSHKADFVKELQAQGKIVAMVGDGINDSNALAQSDVSIAMGKGSDIAMDVAKMTIISSELSRIPKAINLSKYTVMAIRQNLFWAFIYNVIGIPIAAGILFPINGFMLSPMIAGAAMALSSVSVVSNSLRLKFKSI
jgi:Cu2+-exporting ATPase